MIRKALALTLTTALLGAPVATVTASSALAAGSAAVTAPATAPTMAPGAIVYDMTGKEIGTVVDVLMNTHNQSYVVLDVKPYVGRDKLVLVPGDHIEGSADHMTMNATRPMVMRMAPIQYNMPQGGH